MPKQAPEKWSKEIVKKNLETNDQWLIRGLLAIYDRQTADEQVEKATNHVNGIGFNGVDAEFMSGMAQWWMAHKFFSKKQIAAIRKHLLKYAGQLARIANSKE